MINVKDVALYVFNENDECFFDANVWIYILGPQLAPNDARSRTYSAALNKLIKTKSKIYVDVLVLSEFTNSYARIEHRSWQIENNSTLDYKQFRKSEDFAIISQSIADSMRRILQFSTPIESDFTAIDLNLITTRFETESCDFNDMMISEICKRKNLILLTHDSDFVHENICVLTANTKLQI